MPFLDLGSPSTRHHIPGEDRGRIYTSKRISAGTRTNQKYILLVLDSARPTDNRADISVMANQNPIHISLEISEIRK